MKKQGGDSAGKLVRRIVESSITAVKPSTLFARGFHLESQELTAFGIRADLSKHEGVRCVAIGKSAEAMALEVRKRLGERVTGIVATPVEKHLKLEGFEFFKTGHPFPDEESVRAGSAVRDFVGSCGRDDLLLFLISGGGSASIFVPVDGVTLDDANRAARLLFDSGTPIDRINLLRRHLSALGGGKLAALAPRQRKISLVMSDVVGDDLAAIASGPTVPDDTSPADAVRFLEATGLTDRIHHSIPAALMRQHVNHSRLKVENSDVRIVGSNLQAVQAAERMGLDNGFNTAVLTRYWESDVGVAARALVSIARSIAIDSLPLARPALVLAAGETTVKISGEGSGGRNQHMELCALKELMILKEKGSALEGATVFSFGTDGKDGNTDAAGAHASDEMLSEIPGGLQEIEDYIYRDDSHSFFKKYGGLITTGPTDTNVMDLFGVVVV